MELKTCPECGVPELVTGEQKWLDNGDIVQKRNQSHRMVFVETDNLDHLFRGIERIIGVGIEDIVITTVRRAVRPFLSAFISADMREKIKNGELEYWSIIDSYFCDMGKLYGDGVFRFVDARYEQDMDDYCTYSISEPLSVPIMVATHIADVEALTGIDQGYTYEAVSPSVYNITAFTSKHSDHLKERMMTKSYEHSDGNLELERCATCSGPKALAEYEWKPDRGVIVNKATGRRMGVLGNAELDPIFQELEAELGDAIPQAVVQAQRFFTKSGYYTADDLTDAAGFREQIALKGLGNLTELVMKRKGMHMCLENVALPLVVVGQAQGFYEMGFGVDTIVDWELSQQGDLEVEVKPLRTEKRDHSKEILWS
jgi:hypothetical protein